MSNTNVINTGVHTSTRTSLSTGSSKLLSLPDELIILIINHIKDKSSLSSLRSSCRRMNDLTIPILFNKIVINPGLCNDSRGWDWWEKVSGYVEEIRLIHHSSITCKSHPDNRLEIGKDGLDRCGYPKLDVVCLELFAEDEWTEAKLHFDDYNKGDCDSCDNCAGDDIIIQPVESYDCQGAEEEAEEGEGCWIVNELIPFTKKLIVSTTSFSTLQDCGITISKGKNQHDHDHVDVEVEELVYRLKEPFGRIMEIDHPPSTPLPCSNLRKLIFIFHKDQAQDQENIDRKEMAMTIAKEKEKEDGERWYIPEEYACDTLRSQAEVLAMELAEFIYALFTATPSPEDTKGGKSGRDVGIVIVNSGSISPLPGPDPPTYEARQDFFKAIFRKRLNWIVESKLKLTSDKAEKEGSEAEAEVIMARIEFTAMNEW